MKTWVKVLIGITVVLVVLLAAAYFAMGYVIYDKLANIKGSCDEYVAYDPTNWVNHPKWPANFDVTPYHIPTYEAVRFPSREPGIEIAAWWIEKEPGAPAVVLVHGMGGCKNAIEVLAPAGMLWRNGFSVLLIDLRDVGESSTENGRSSIGNEEYRDVLGAWDWLVKEKGLPPSRVGLFANSLGGATALYAMSEEPQVAALFLQSTFGNLQQVLMRELQRGGYPTLLAPAAIIMGRVAGGENLVEHNPLDAIRKVGNRPVYIVHSKADTRMDVNQSEQLAAAGEAAGVPVTTWFPDGAEHVQTPAVYPQEFEQRMVGFFREALGQ
jgi:uncharacterized protein